MTSIDSRKRDREAEQLALAHSHEPNQEAEEDATASQRLSKVTKIPNVVKTPAVVDGDLVKDILGFGIIEQYNTGKPLLSSKLANFVVRGFYVLRDRRVTSFTAA